MTKHIGHCNTAVMQRLSQPNFISFATLMSAIKSFLTEMCAPKLTSSAARPNATLQTRLRFDISRHGTAFLFTRNILKEISALRHTDSAKYYLYIKHLTGISRVAQSKQVDLAEVLEKADGEATSCSRLGRDFLLSCSTTRCPPHPTTRTSSC